MQQQVRRSDGSWRAVQAADWDFRYALGGNAVQDFWVQPPASVAVDANGSRQYGTNLRIYDRTADTWQIVWAASDEARLTAYTASETDAGELVMTGDDPERPGVTQRITYFDIRPESWQWKLEFSRDGQTWLEVARILATRR